MGSDQQLPADAVNASKIGAIAVIIVGIIAFAYQEISYQAGRA